ncbi:MAG: GNAT family N-acetyltransferase [Actinobacteria bacterium]|nr:GNAT family N-acetyltransferase [Actinomycetota bacterium]
MEIRRLTADGLDAIGEIDRSERIEVSYAMEDGVLVATEVDRVVPPWRTDGSGEHTVGEKVGFCRPIVERGGVLLGAFDGRTVMGVAVVEPSFEPGLAWLAFLHVGRPHRRKGAASVLWEEAERIAREAGARTMYVSATPSGSAVGFYLSRGCVPAPDPHPVLHAMEPEDIHLVRPLGE